MADDGDVRPGRGRGPSSRRHVQASGAVRRLKCNRCTMQCCSHVKSHHVVFDHHSE